MGNNQILEATIKVFSECSVRSFPFNELNLLEHYGYTIFTYDELLSKNCDLYNMCMACSEDAFRDGHNMIVAYNSHKHKGRIRFTLMHELGHHILNHIGDSDLNEQEANAFASNILAPRMAIHYAKCKNAEDVSKIFQVSHEAAIHAYNDYRRWYRHVIKYKMTGLDKAIYSQFYNTEYDGFVYSIKNCDFCGKVLYNSHSDHCKLCCVPEVEERRTYFRQEPLHNIDMGLFRKLENQWLYGGL